MTDRSPAVVLLSGGLDSTTCLAIARDQGFACHALSFRYGQRHEERELGASAEVAKALGAASHRVLEINLRAIGGSALTDDNIAVPKGRRVEEIGAEAINRTPAGARGKEGHQGSGVPVTYVPARNTIFLSFALAWAEVLGSADIFIGVNALDYSGYPDCRPAFIDAFEALAKVATAAGGEEGAALKIHAPLLDLDKAGIVRRGVALGVDYGLTHTCYDPEPEGACGGCDACLLRLKGFTEAGLEDPIPYATR
ncbi:MAG: 7-cyano-7-deazaguanine synthase QueC [Proteobacteria bacterium]|nr:MAG: 7-cyano-7-deazaguanine synthase QueC [Pseudomonadota bacterium]